MIIPAGTCSWDEAALQNCPNTSYKAAVCLTKNIILTGEGSANTIIQNGVTTADGAGVVYRPFIYYPATPSASATFELSNITFDMNAGKDIFLQHASTTVMQQIKLHHLVVTDASLAFWFGGNYKGVIYSNTITTTGQLQQNVGGGLGIWQTFKKCTAEGNCTHDDGNNLYWEDNVLNIGDTILESGGHGFSWVSRYNTINYIRAVPMFEWHGNYGVGNNRCSAMDMAVYGNYMHWVMGDVGVGSFVQPRGGMGMIFFNLADQGNDWSITLQDEAAENQGDCNGVDNVQPQHVSDTYAWANINGAKVIPEYMEDDDTGDIVENAQFWLQRAGSFDGSGDSDKGGGVGCGSGDPPATCTTGVGYWKTSQSCTDIAALTGAVGRSGGRATTATKIEGTLYKCTGNAWTPYYTPYQYPHPLRGTGKAAMGLGSGASMSITAGGATLTLQ